MTAEEEARLDRLERRVQLLSEQVPLLRDLAREALIVSLELAAATTEPNQAARVERGEAAVARVGELFVRLHEGPLSRRHEEVT